MHTIQEVFHVVAVHVVVFVGGAIGGILELGVGLEPVAHEAARAQSQGLFVVRVAQLQAQHQGQVHAGGRQLAFLELPAVGFAHHVGAAIGAYPLVVAAQHEVVEGKLGAHGQANGAALAAEPGVPAQADVHVARAFGAQVQGIGLAVGGDVALLVHQRVHAQIENQVRLRAAVLDVVKAGGVALGLALGAGEGVFLVVAEVDVDAGALFQFLFQQHLHSVAAGAVAGRWLVGRDAHLLGQLLAGAVLVGVKLHRYLAGAAGFGGGFGLRDVAGQARGERVELVVLQLAQLGHVAHYHREGGPVGQAHHNGVLGGSPPAQGRGTGGRAPPKQHHEQQKKGEKSALHDF